MKKFLLNQNYIIAAFLMFASPVYAHQDNAMAHGFSEAFFHPWQGIDHLLVMLTIGLWCRTIDSKAKWQVPVSFISLMAVGTLLQSIGFRIDSAEMFIAMTVLFCGLLLWGNWRFSRLWAHCISGIIALSHGYVHGCELKIVTATNPFIPLLGLLLSTLVLMLLGIFAGSFVKLMRLGFGGICIATGLYQLAG